MFSSAPAAWKPGRPAFYGNIMSYMAYPYYLPAEGITMVVLLNSGADVPGSWAMMQDITKIITPNNLWPGLPKQ